MMKPTEANQKKWVKMHLNGGRYFPDADQHLNDICRDENRHPSHDHACYAAMCWIDRCNLRSLAEVWDKCRDRAWLFWMFSRMSPTPEERRRFLDMYHSYPPSQLRKRVRNPWVMENWEKGFFIEPKGK